LKDETGQPGEPRRRQLPPEETGRTPETAPDATTRKARAARPGPQAPEATPGPAAPPDELGPTERGSASPTKPLAVYALTAPGARLAEKIALALEAELHLPRRLDRPTATALFDKLGEALAEGFGRRRGHVVVAAAGLVVRLVAPLLGRKSADPAVVCLGQDGRFVVSLLSGHLGGANELARDVAAVTGGQPVISTATDLAGAPALETVARDLGLAWENLDALPAVSRTLAEGGRVPVVDPGGFLLPTLAAWPEAFEPADAPPADRPAVLADWRLGPVPPTTWTLRPPALALGLGCHRGVDPAEVEALARELLRSRALAPASVRFLATVDRRADEPALRALARRWRRPLLTFTAQELSEAEVPNPSDVVRRRIGAPSVCEAAARLAARLGPLAAPKIKSPRATCAAALIDWTSSGWARPAPKG
jgi:cobalt-precorrin 5A hydrolase